MTAKLLWVATFISVATFLFWSVLPKGGFYIGNALFVFIICSIIYKQNKELFIAFFLLCISLNNLIDESFFDNTKLGINELFLVIILPVIWQLKKRICLKDLRKAMFSNFSSK
jgi:hypothetical protein